MSGRNHDGRCQMCGEMVNGVWEKYCTNCRKERKRLGMAKTNMKMLGYAKGKKGHCEVCGAEIDPRCRRCSDCTNNRWRSRVRAEEMQYSVRRKFGWWYDGPEPGGKAIYQG